jgi:hypothetical protein
MDIVVKVSKNYVDFTAQFINPGGMNFSNQLVNFGKMSFELDINDSQIGEILEKRKVAVYAIEGITDQLLWTGVIEDPVNDSKTVIVNCAEEKGYMRDKQVFTDKNYQTDSISDVLDELTSESNARDGGFNGSLTFSTNMTVDAEKEFTAGTSYAQILDELALLHDAEWTVRLNQIIFNETVGSDKTSGPDLILLTSTRQNPNENNVSNFSIKRNGRAITTSLMGKDSSGTSKKDGDTSVFGFIEKSENFDDGNLDTQTQELVNKRSVTQREITLDVVSNFVDFRDIDVGDLIKLKIDYESPLAQIDDSLKVVEKTVAFVNKKPRVGVRVAKLAKPIDDFTNFLRKLNTRVGRLELQ